MERPSDSSLIIGVATSTAERVQLARLLGGADALLLVSSAEQARTFLALTGVTSSAGPVVLTPTVLPIAEQHAQIMAVPTPEPEPVLEEELYLDVDRRVVRWKDREVPLTRLEHDFLHCLVEEPGRVWTYQHLHHAVWGNEHLGHGSHIHSVVKRLRQKLANLGATVTIHAVRGVGFHLLPTA
ncbi:MULTISPECIES: winged helix-turn-helix domain-containing protein [unclassified Kribbella]|uniref:winged helix-turn-helix domain-containing protein n=1 Tax=unclassified Kribbella TaxID=2644121 RepID=UPI0037B4D245|nr:winged helix-turn-helix domain-containing protein [Kribbella sp. NBC_00889]